MFWCKKDKNGKVKITKKIDSLILPEKKQAKKNHAKILNI